eukprot:545166-Amphidinium_carterae.2
MGIHSLTECRLGQSVQASGADRVCIVSVMGTYRTGKSFLLDLLMRHLNHRIKEETKYAPVVATNEPQLPSLGTNGEDCMGTCLQPKAA